MRIMRNIKWVFRNSKDVRVNADNNTSRAVVIVHFLHNNGCSRGEDAPKKTRRHGREIYQR